ncbi:hypothetical protein ACFQPG_06860 [Sphingomonas sp. GCM10030256]|uniref:hypothetical protein n=1 Tax=Sphingomonas sp. GCM10030256 TaxID=3273427 RepID=UPI0036104B09
MSEKADWIAILSALSSIAVAVIGFSGLLTAFRSASAPLTRLDMVYIRILLIFGLGALTFALLPLPFAAVAPERLWPTLTILLALFLLFWPVRSPIWNRARGIRPRRPRLFYGILAAQALLGLLLLLLGIRGDSDGGAYAAGVAWCLLVAMVTFVAQVFSMLPVDED